MHGSRGRADVGSHQVTAKQASRMPARRHFMLRGEAQGNFNVMKTLLGLANHTILQYQYLPILIINRILRRSMARGTFLRKVNFLKTLLCFILCIYVFILCLIKISLKLMPKICSSGLIFIYLFFTKLYLKLNLNL